MIFMDVHQISHRHCNAGAPFFAIDSHSAEAGLDRFQQASQVSAAFRRPGCALWLDPQKKKYMHLTLLTRACSHSCRCKQYMHQCCACA